MTRQPGDPLRPGLASAIESDAERTAKRIVPWVASAALHGALIALGFLLTWTVMSLGDDEEPLRVTADFHNLSYDPLVRLADGVTPLDRTAAPQEATLEPVKRARSRQPVEVELDLHQLADVARPSPMGRFTPAATGESATFLGLTTTNARRVVYVIDASGSMIRTLPIVIDELGRSLEALSPKQEFGVVFFQRNEAVTVPPASRLVAATLRAKLAALEWIDANVVPAGRSNPLAAIEKGLSLDPDVIFLLSENITGSGQFEIDQADLLALLEKLNPRRDGGVRRARISCVQFLYPDPLDTLREIAARHGGDDGYKFLDAAELGISAP